MEVIPDHDSNLEKESSNERDDLNKGEEAQSNKSQLDGADADLREDLSDLIEAQDVVGDVEIPTLIHKEKRETYSHDPNSLKGLSQTFQGIKRPHL